MQDRVADVLAQRAALDNGFLAGVLLSILLHGGATAAAIYAALHTAPPQIASVLNIKFAPMRVPAAAVVKPAAPPKPATPRIESPKPQPVKPIETKKAPERNTVPLSPFGKSTKKGSENPVIAPPVTGNRQPVTDPASQPVTFDGGDFPYTVYIDRMTTKLGAAFFRPQGTSSVVGVYFVIDRDGTIRDAKIESSSGNSTLDRAALRAVLESSPLGPLPFGYSGTYLGVHLKFR
jgi:TonB family protein